MSDIPTYDGTCPWCGKEIETLFDMLRSAPGHGSGDCPWCGQPVDIETDIEYTIYKAEDGEDGDH